MARDCNHSRVSDGFSNETWLSLLGLLQPIEYLFTVDTLPAWRKHVAWAKTDGAELRNYTIQRFGSIMVFLSLMLGLFFNFLFGSTTQNEGVIVAMRDNAWTELRFYIGIAEIVAIGVTICALVATFTAWSMVSAISDENVHCVLRSSIGQYVCYLPARLVLSSIYLFLLLVVLWTVDLTTGCVTCLLLAFILALFFQVVVAFSAFGSLILNTGAMGKKRVLDEDLERALVPSGLHASLLIKACAHQRKPKSVTARYKLPAPLFTKKTQRTQPEKDDSPSVSTTMLDVSSQQSDRDYCSSKSSSSFQSSMANSANQTILDSQDYDSYSETTRRNPRSANHHKNASLDDEDFRRICETSQTLVALQNKDDPQTCSEILERRHELVARHSRLLGPRQLSRKKVWKEWDQDVEARDTYNVSPPAQLLSSEETQSLGPLPTRESILSLPRASILNRSHHLKSLRQLSQGQHDLQKTGCDSSDNESHQVLSKMFTPVTTFFQSLGGKGSASSGRSAEKTGGYGSTGSRHQGKEDATVAETCCLMVDSPAYCADPKVTFGDTHHNLQACEEC